MPQWLCNQLMRAFQTKNVRKIKLLGDCWYFYRTQGTVQERRPDNPAKKTERRGPTPADKRLDSTQV